MDIFIRISENDSYRLSNEYSNKYQTYNCISSVLDRIETQNGGLYPVEVWTEVLRLEKLLLTATRRDKFIAEQRTRLENKYRKIIIKNDGTAIERDKQEAERSVMCVFLALAMHLNACPDDKPNPHKPILKNIYRMVLEYDKEMAMAIADAYNAGEDEEEEAGYIVQPHDPLYEEEKKLLSAEQLEVQEKINLIFDFYATILYNESCVNAKYSSDDFFIIWDDIVKEESIVKQMLVVSPKIKPNIKDGLTKAEDAKKNDYNLKLVLNIIGLMREDIVTASIGEINSLFFTDSKAPYLSKSKIVKYGTSESGIADKEMYDLICSIINKHKNGVNSSQ